MKKIKTSFTIYIKDSKYFNSVFSTLRLQSFKVSKIDNENNKIFATKNVTSCIEATDLDSYILSLDGVKESIVTYEYTEEKVKWYKVSVIPIILSALITALTILAIVYPLKEIDDTYKTLAIIIPTIITVFIQIIYRYFREEPIL